MKRIYLFSLVLLCSLMTALAGEATVSPTLDVNFRTASGNTAWQYAKDASAEGNNNFELNYANSQYFDLQGRKIANPTKGLYIVNGKKVVKY